MKFVYNCARLPTNRDLVVDIDAAANRLFDKLKFLDLDSLQISDYNKMYLASHIKHLQASLQRYAYVLIWATAAIDIPLANFTLVDYGGGTGILSLLAKELRVGTVVYNDIYDISCNDAKVIGGLIGNRADYFVLGDIDDVIKFLRANSLTCNAIVSDDVIEHIYDIEEFLGKLCFLSKNSLNVVMSTGANSLNQKIKRALSKKQLEAEYKDREETWGHKKRDCLRSYRKVREEIILSYAPNLAKEKAKQLSMLTRGMMESDIKDCINLYIKGGILPKSPTHPTNTCDPYTGNWAEHLMNPYRLAFLLSRAGFKAEVLSGYRGEPHNIIRKIAGGVLNLLTAIFPGQSIIIAPFFILYGKKS